MFLRIQKKNISYKVIEDNYILTQSDDYNFILDNDNQDDKFDFVIGNPPYLKIGKNAPEALAMPDVCYGAPNLYFLFASMSIFNLKDNCELVYIIPRSWTSGAYFKAFRKKVFSSCVIENIHLFVSRDKVFDNENVLQETIIIKIRKTLIKPDYIRISSTNTNKDFTKLVEYEAPYSSIVSGTDNYVFLVTNENEKNVINKLNKWKDTLPSIGLKMKTGLTVDFRNRDALSSIPEPSSIPLFYSQHIQNGFVNFPIGKENEYLNTEQKGLIQKNSNYLFVKRFTAKEEHRRLQCGVYIARKHPGYEKISTQNKINFIAGAKELSECLVYGLYVLFNSTFYDLYYRILNGSTQVNSTEVNSMPVPPLEIIQDMGKKLISNKDMSEESCDKILGEYVYG